MTLKEVVRSALPKTVKRHTVHRGLLRGISIYTSWHDYPGAILGYTETPLLRWFQRHVAEGETWIDVGAHYGYTAVALSQLVGESGLVVAFEPIPDSSSSIVRTKAANRLDQLQVVPIGLSAAASLDVRQVSVVRGMADDTTSECLDKQYIYTASLDAIWDTICTRNPVVSGIKIDVQGMEAEVIRGMMRTLATYGPKLVLEFHSGVDRDPILRSLVECGYRSIGEPIESSETHTAGLYLDNRSYAFYCP